MTASKAPQHTWKFFRAGGLDQVRLETAADLQNLENLDQKLWVALSCPTRGLEFDSKTLDLIDTDKDGRIRAPELLAAIKWARQHLKNPEDLLKASDALPLSEINDAIPSGAKILASARRILKSLDKGDSAIVSIDDAADTAKIFAQTKFNGDGVVPPESASDSAAKQVIEEIMATVGGVADRGGKQGVNKEKADLFFSQAKALSDWNAAVEGNTSILPLGNATAAAFDALQTVRAKIDDYFTRCQLAAFDGRAAAPLNRAETEFAALATKDLTLGTDEIRKLPLAHVEPGKALPLGSGINPAWAETVSKFQLATVAPLLGAGKSSLSLEDWAGLKTKLAPYEAWLASKPAAAVEKLGIARLRQILSSKSQEAIQQLIAEDLALQPEIEQIADVEKLVRFHRDLHPLLKNFVSFTDFYSGKRKGIFQVGTLYLDARSCDLCVRVEDMSKHGVLANLSRSYLAYCDCTRRGSTDKMTIAAAFTAGDSDNLMVGRNGVFYDRKGQDWDATIVKIVDHPISIRQAVWSPYKKVIRLIETQIEKFAASKEKAMEEKAAAGIESAATRVAQPPAPGPAPATKKEAFDIARFAGIFAAIGMAVGYIGGAVAGFLSKFVDLPVWKMPLVVLGLFVAVSGPSVIIAALKLRQRNLGPILDANGWAVNARVKINIPFGSALTATAVLPPNSVRSLEDPFAEKRSKGRIGFWALLVLLTLLVVLMNTEFGQRTLSNWLSEKPVLILPKVHHKP